jgi:hypothetical protein
MNVKRRPDSAPQTLNKYAYVRNNPIRYVDPDGHCPWCIGAFIGGGIGLGAELLADWTTGQPVPWQKAVGAAISGAIVGGTGGAAEGLALPIQIALLGDAGLDIME